MSRASQTAHVVPAPQDGAPQAAAEPREAQRERSGKRKVAAVVGLFALAVGGYFTARAFGAGEETTDDAAVDAEIVPVSARVAGQVLTVKVADNTRVKKGEVLVELDPAEARARVQQAEGELAAAEAQAAAADAQLEIATAGARGGLSAAKAQVTTTRAQVGSAQAQIDAAKAQLARAETEAHKSQVDLERAKQLYAANAISRERLDSAQTTADSAQAGLQAAHAQLFAAEEARRVAESRVAEASGMVDVNAPIDAKIAAARSAAQLAHARVSTAQAALELARLTLSYTTITAPLDGTVAKLSLRPGHMVVPSQIVAQVVPDTTYVVANFKETQVGRMAPGQHVAVEFDTYPGLKVTGVVESITPATGSRFSLLAPDNASGNFVKVVQRVPVKIVWDAPPTVTLRPGMSAVAHVRVGG